VFGGLAALSILFGVLAYERYAKSEQWVKTGIDQMDVVGKKLDAEGCIDAAMQWHHGCEENDANAAVCLQAVKIQMYHCLKAQDRSGDCEGIANPPDEGKWVYEACSERGNRCVNKRECVCAQTYRSFDSFCRTGQEAVQL
jgi:hypothetical protein